ncbi:hypothetical protein D9757_003530 [Collybiopsis confluens]|uniref:Uncharacterized protein n=1 Tax=Collybiopsis confluens TaxID=2823264 RepID=A0A8H5HTN8_9AGAR|nr:hypothetical protein D9757_003530 [Collybiopsis confluens]
MNNIDDHLPADVEQKAIPIPPRSSMSSRSVSRRTSTDTRSSKVSSSHSSSSTRTRERSKTSSSSRELALLLAVEKGKSEALKLSLDEAHKELTAMRRRIEEAETNLVEVTSAFMKANKERLSALQNAALAHEERELYRVQLLSAQTDIDKAKDVVKNIDKKRVKAERDAAAYKRSARELREERLILAAREDGRRLGFREGVLRARAEVGFLDIDEDGYVTPPTRSRPESLNEEGASFYTGEDENEDELDSDSEPLPHPMPSELPSIRNASPQLQSNPAPLPRDEPILPPIITNGPIQPTTIHNFPASPRHPPVSIPPDGMIPVDGEFGIMLPPPHELSPMPPIIEALPAFSQRNVEEEPRIVPPPGQHRASMYASEYYRGSSPDSESTSMSQFDMLAEPQSLMANISPMSAIEEVASGYTSPNPPSMHGGDLHRSSSMHSTSSNHGQTPRAQPENLPETNYYSSQKIGRKQSMTSVSSSKRAKSPPSTNIPPAHRPYSPPQISNIYTNPRYQTANDVKEYTRSTASEAGRRSQTPSQRSTAPYAQTESGQFVPRPSQTSSQRSTASYAHTEPAHFIPPEPSSSSSTRKPSRKSSVTSAASSSRTAGTKKVISPPAVPTTPRGELYTTLAPPEAQIEAVSPRTESSDDNINVSILSPTPPGSARNGNEEGIRNPLNEFLSPRDAERPMPMPGTPSPRLHPINLPQDPSPLPTAPFGPPNIGTPIALSGNGGIFVASGFTPKPSSGPQLSSSSPGPTMASLDPKFNDPGEYSYSSFGIPSSNQRPVIPDPTLLGAPDSDSDSSDRVSSGLNSDANTLTTPPNMTRGLPPQRGRGAKGNATGKKKRQR